MDDDFFGKSTSAAAAPRKASGLDDWLSTPTSGGSTAGTAAAKKSALDDDWLFGSTTTSTTSPAKKIVLTGGPAGSSSSGRPNMFGDAPESAKRAGTSAASTSYNSGSSASGEDDLFFGTTTTPASGTPSLLATPSLQNPSSYSSHDPYEYHFPTPGSVASSMGTTGAFSAALPGGGPGGAAGATVTPELDDEERYDIGIKVKHEEYRDEEEDQAAEYTEEDENTFSRSSNARGCATSSEVPPASATSSSTIEYFSMTSNDSPPRQSSVEGPGRSENLHLHAGGGGARSRGVSSDHDAAGSGVAASRSGGEGEQPDGATSSSQAVVFPAQAKFEYQTFLNKVLKHPSAAPTVHNAKLFVDQVNALPMEKKHTAVASFKAYLPKLHAKLLDAEIYEDACELGKQQALEGLEKFVATKVYSSVFRVNELDDSRRDRNISTKLTSLKWLRLHQHLDVSPEVAEHPKIEVAKDFFTRLNEYKAPRDKLICLQNVCKVLINAIEQSAKRQNGSKSAGADDLLPVLIFVLIQVNPPNLHSNLEYIQNFHLQLETEAGEGLYYLTTVKSAVEFLRHMDHSAVSNVSRGEFEFNCEDILRPLGLELELEPGEPGYIEPGTVGTAKASGSSGASTSSTGAGTGSSSASSTTPTGAQTQAATTRASKKSSNAGSSKSSGHSTPNGKGGGAGGNSRVAGGPTSASSSGGSTAALNPAATSTSSAALLDAEREIASRHLIFPLDKDRRLMLREFEHHFKQHKMDTLTIREVPQLLSDYKALSRFFVLLQESYYEQEKKYPAGA